MKHTINLTLIAVITFFITGCTNQSVQQAATLNPDSINEIIKRNFKDMGRHPENFSDYCEDSLLGMYDREFWTSAHAFGKDPFQIFGTPHDSTYRLFGQTFVVSFLQSFSEIIQQDTVTHHLRIMNVFALDNGKWKWAANSDALQPVNYFREVTEKHQKLFTEYAGLYEWKKGVTDTVYVKNGKLYEAITIDNENLIYEDYPVSDSEYMVKNDLGRIVFGRDASGKIAYYTYIRHDGQRIRIPKIK